MSDLVVMPMLVGETLGIVSRNLPIRGECAGRPFIYPDSLSAAGSHSSADLTAALSQSDAAGSFRIEFIVGLRFSARASVYYFPILKSKHFGAWFDILARFDDTGASVVPRYPSQ